MQRHHVAVPMAASDFVAFICSAANTDDSFNAALLAAAGAFTCNFNSQQLKHIIIKQGHRKGSLLGMIAGRRRVFARDVWECFDPSAADDSTQTFCSIGASASAS